jgi:hypothetical protein
MVDCKNQQWGIQTPVQMITTLVFRHQPSVFQHSMQK